MTEDINYYNKYLKYKKKYLDLERKYHKHEHRHGHRHRHHFINPFIQTLPIGVPIISSPILSSPIRPASPILVSSPNLPILVSSPIRANLPIFRFNEYREFDPAFDFINSRFDRDLFVKIFKRSYNEINKSYEGITLPDILRDRQIIEAKLIEENIFTPNTYNSFELLMSKIAYKYLNYQSQLQDYIKKYVVLNEMNNILA